MVCKAKVIGHTQCVCLRQLYVTTEGLRHIGEDGAPASFYWQFCRECGWEGSVIGFVCPCCGSKELRDDHCARENRS